MKSLCLIRADHEGPIPATERSVVTRMLGLLVRIPPEHGCLSLLSIVCCQVEVSATGRSLVQGSATKCGVSECDLETSISRMPRPPRTVEPRKKMFMKGYGGMEV
jgi:hypothetical protein